MPNQWTGPRDPSERFWEKVNKDGPEGCWLWTAYILVNGYGLFGLRKNKMILAHRFAYQDAIDQIPSGLVIDHLCRVRHCVNPSHLEAVTQRENVRRGFGGANNSSKTHCPNGHEYTCENTYSAPCRPNSRYCRACRREKNRRQYYKLKSQRETTPVG